MWGKVYTSFVFVFVFFLQVGLKGHLFGRQLKKSRTLELMQKKKKFIYF